MTAFCLFDSVERQAANHIHAKVIEFGKRYGHGCEGTRADAQNDYACWHGTKGVAIRL